jgi:hypothetical protein
MALYDSFITKQRLEGSNNLVRYTKAGGIEIRSFSEHQNYNLENVYITTATLIKFTQKIIH